MSDLIPVETCLKYAEICKLRHSRLMDIQESLLFQSLEKICIQAAKAEQAELLAERRADQIKQEREDARRVLEATQ